MAQDFFAAFGHDGVGTIGTDTTINSGDMEGVLNADLKARLEKLERASFAANAE